MSHFKTLLVSLFLMGKTVFILKNDIWLMKGAMEYNSFTSRDLCSIHNVCHNQMRHIILKRVYGRIH
jgi:hypothetical protein